MLRQNLVEGLENRVFFSVGASVLSGPLTTGFTYKYTQTFDGVTGPVHTVTVLGPATFNGNSAIRKQDVASEGNRVITSNDYQLIDPLYGFVSFGGETILTGNGSAGVHSITTKSSPRAVYAPPVLTAGVVYSASWTDTEVTISGTDNKRTTDTISSKYTMKLVSDTTQKITVPAGTFNCWQFIQTYSDTFADGSKDSGTTTIWAQNGVGLVKAVDGTSSYQLTEFKTATTGRLGFGVQPGPAVVGAAVRPSPTVLIQNALGVTNTSSTATVKLAILSGPTGAVLGGTTSVAAVAGVATFNNITLSKPGTYQLVATSGSLLAADSITFVVGVPTKLAFTAKPSSVVAGATFSPVKVAIQSAAGIVATNNTSSVTLSITSGPAGATLGGTLTVPAVAGVATFSNLKLTRAGTYTIKAVDGTLTPTTFTVTVTPAAAAKLAITQQPTSAVAGVTLGGFTVKVQDAFGNVVTNNTSSIVLSLVTKPANGTLGATAPTKPAVAGAVTFVSLNLKIAGTYTIKATSGSLTAAVSNAINIVAAKASKLVFTQQALTGKAGVALSPVFVVKIQDAFGNVVLTDTSTATLAISTGPTGGALLGTKSVKAIKGVVTFAGLSFSKIGSYTIRATDGTLTSAVSKAVVIS